MGLHKSLPFGVSLLVFLLLLTSLIPMNRAHAEVSVSARAAILMDQTSGRVLYEKNSHEPMRIASITKVMTAILAIESGKMNKTVTISSDAAGTEGSSIYLRAGQKWKLRDLVYGLMLRSGNDAAVAIAEAVGGSKAGFAHLMNQKARELGMKDTHFSNPHGLDDSNNHYSSAYDMAVLTRYAMKNKEFRKISSTKTYTVKHDDMTQVFRNKNKLLFRYEYSTGGKTGYTKLAHRTLISTASKDGMGLVVVTLDDGDDWQDHTNLCNWAFSNYHLKTIVKKGVISGIKNEFYRNHIYAKRSLVFPLTAEEEQNLSTSISLYDPPKKMRGYKPPEPVGMVYIKTDEGVLAKLPLYYKKEEQKNKGFWSSFVSIFMASIGVVSHD